MFGTELLNAELDSLATRGSNPALSTLYLASLVGFPFSTNGLIKNSR
jgi:hypothetical protein